MSSKEEVLLSSWIFNKITKRFAVVAFYIKNCKGSSEFSEVNSFITCLDDEQNISSLNKWWKTD